jgi:hypothetical protein
MSDFVKNLTDSIAQQALELAELKQTVADLNAKLNPPKPEPVEVDWRKAIPTYTPDQLAAMVAADAKARADAAQARHDAAREGLEPGYWRDNCGLVRDHHGKIALTGEGLEQKLAREAEFDRAARAEDLAWRRAVELPIRHGADDAE